MPLVLRSRYRSSDLLEIGGSGERQSAGFVVWVEN